MRGAFAAGLALALAAAAPGAAQAPRAEALYRQLAADGDAGRYWRALDKAFPDEGPRLLARALDREPDPRQAVARVYAAADRLPWEEPQVLMRAPDDLLLAQQQAMADVYRAALRDDVGPCAAGVDRRRMTTPAVERAWATWRLAVMESAAAGRLEPVERPRAGATDHALYDQAYRKLRASAGVPPEEDLEQLSRPDYCRAQIAAHAALKRLPADAAGRIAAHMVHAAAAVPEE